MLKSKITMLTSAAPGWFAEFQHQEGVMRLPIAVWVAVVERDEDGKEYTYIDSVAPAPNESFFERSGDISNYIGSVYDPDFVRSEVV